MTIEPITVERYKTKRFVPVVDYQFAIQDTTAPVVLRELRKVAMCLPFGFTFAKGQPTLTALLGLQTNQNLVINPEGTWLVDYIPAVFRAYPFSLRPHSENGKLILCVDGASSRFSETQGEFLFDQEGKNTVFLNKILMLLNHIAENNKETLRVCALLDRLSLIVPWTISHLIGTADAKREMIVQGFHRIDETAFNALSSEQFEELRSEGCLPLIYSHLLSFEHLPKMWKRFEARLKDEAAIKSAPDELATAAVMINDQTTLSFENLFSQAED